MLASGARPAFRSARDVPIRPSMGAARRLAEIAKAFAESVAEGNFAAAEGWLAVASFVRADEEGALRGAEAEPPSYSG